MHPRLRGLVAPSRSLGSLALSASLAAALAPQLGCGDDTAAGTGGSGGGASSGGTTTGGTTTTAATTSGGPGSGGGDTTSSTSSAGGGGSTSVGSGGGGGTNWEGVDPLEGIGQVTQVAADFEFVEGPLWLASLGVLRWSDIPPARIHQLDAGDAVTTWRSDSGGSNGLALRPDGSMIACEGAARRVSTSPIDAPAFTLVVDRFEGDRFNAPNDAIVRSDGTIFFTDPDYSLPGPDHEIGFNGVYRVDPGGDVHLVDDGRVLPNGIALSIDESVLYVADNGSSELWTYAVADDGQTSEGVLLTATAGGPDGMAVDDGGNLYVTTEDGIDVRRADGTPWGTIPVPEVPANCSFGGPDRNVLYITARTGLYRVQLVIPGPP